MAEETQIEAPTQVTEEATQEDQQKPAEAKKPKRNNQVAELQRIKDREVAEANKARSEAERRASQVETELAAVRREIDLLREHSGISEDEETRIKALLSKESQLEQREKTTSQHERTLTIKYLASEYGVPAEDLEAYDNPKDMEIAALKWARMNNVADDPDEVDEQEPEPEPVRSSFDLGSGPAASKSFADMTKQERDAWESVEKRKALARMRGR